MFSGFKLTQKQEETVEKVQERCISTCEFIHPIETEDALECSNKCKENNKELYRMGNASKIGVYISVALLLISLFLSLN